LLDALGVYFGSALSAFAPTSLPTLVTASAPTPTSTVPKEVQSTKNDSGDSGVSIGVIVGIVVGAVIVLGALGMVLARRQRKDTESPSATSNNTSARVLVDVGERFSTPTSESIAVSLSIPMAEAIVVSPSEPTAQAIAFSHEAQDSNQAKAADLVCEELPTFKDQARTAHGEVMENHSAHERLPAFKDQAGSVVDGPKRLPTARRSDEQG